jgi:hypothetical protein
MFRPMELWRHKNCLDIDLYICKVQFQHKDYVMAKVMYWNHRYQAFAHSDSETVKIYRKDFYKWKLVEGTCP